MGVPGVMKTLRNSLTETHAPPYPIPPLTICLSKMLAPHFHIERNSEWSNTVVSLTTPQGVEAILNAEGL